jgi:hypothetical protein
MQSKSLFFAMTIILGSLLGGVASATVQYSTVQYSTVQYSTVQYSTALAPVVY